MINNIVLVSGVQHSDAVIHTHVSILFQILILINIKIKSIFTILVCTLSQQIKYNIKTKRGEGARWRSRKILGWPPAMDTPKLQLHLEKLSLRKT